ncbi:MAG: hypothetical protein U9Q61_06580 [Thermodesulfobacteriota bacterium]|nr:hypothetical protein [Thermodesulfobacteriota bacterium]
MHRSFGLLLLLLSFSLFQVNSGLAFDLFDIEASGVDIGLGYRSDQLDWNISGDINGENPDILSELSWEDLEVFQVQATGWLELGELPFLKRNSLIYANIAFGKILGGDVQDSDYAGDGRTFEWSRSVNDSDKGLTIDLAGAVGPIFELNLLEGLSITPLIGYGFNMQDFSMTNGRQTLSNRTIRKDYFGSDAEMPPPLGPIEDLDSNYTAYWYGPWFGVNVDYQANQKIKITVGAEYHWVEYFAQADWNLRSDFAHPVSFEQETTGTGFVWNIKGQYSLNKNWSWLFDGKIQTWEAESGTDRIYFSDGTAGMSRLNQVNWSSYALMTGVQYQF